MAFIVSAESDPGPTSVFRAREKRAEGRENDEGPEKSNISGRCQGSYVGTGCDVMHRRWVDNV